MVSFSCVWAATNRRLHLSLLPAMLQFPPRMIRVPLVISLNIPELYSSQEQLNIPEQSYSMIYYQWPDVIPWVQQSTNSGVSAAHLHSSSLEKQGCQQGKKKKKNRLPYLPIALPVKQCHYSNKISHYPASRAATEVFAKLRFWKWL